MQINGAYVGIGLNDQSTEVRKLKDFVIRKWDRFDTHVTPGDQFDFAFQTIISELQAIYRDQGKLTEPHIPGVVNLATKYVLGYLKKDVLLPLYFSAEGHMSDMWVGPVSWVGEVLRAEGRALHFPTYYQNTSIPFKTWTGVQEMARRVSQTVQDNGVKFPAGTPWAMGGFSEGGLLVSKFYLTYLQPGQPLHWRLKDLRGVLAAGNAYREKGVVAEWVPDPPEPDRQGLSDVRLVNTPWWWKEIARKGDLYTDNQSEGDRALFKTSIYKIIAEGKFSGGPAGFMARIADLVTPADDLFPLALSIFDGMRFLTNMGPHGIYNMDPAVQFMRDQLAGPPVAA